MVLTDVTDNGTATKIADSGEGEGEEKANAAEVSEAQPPADEPVPEKVEAPVAEAEPAKPSALCVALGRLACVIGQTCLSLRASAACLARSVLGLPWDSIFTTVTSIGTSLAITFAYWTLTEDLIVVVRKSLFSSLNQVCQTRVIFDRTDYAGYLPLCSLPCRKSPGQGLADRARKQFGRGTQSPRRCRLPILHLQDIHLITVLR